MFPIWWIICLEAARPRLTVRNAGSWIRDVRWAADIERLSQNSGSLLITRERLLGQPRKATQCRTESDQVDGKCYALKQKAHATRIIQNTVSALEWTARNVSE